MHIKCLLVGWQMSGKCWAQTCRPARLSLMITRQKSLGKTAINFSVRDQVFGVYSQLCHLYTKGHLAWEHIALFFAGVYPFDAVL
jgi:hypothetical protein